MSNKQLKEITVEEFSLFEQFTDLLPISLFWFDLDFIIKGMNQRALDSTKFYSKDAVINKPLPDIYPRKLAEKMIADNQHVIRTKEILVTHCSWKNVKSQKTQYFICFRAPLLNSIQKCTGIIAALVDITAEKNKLRKTKSGNILRYLKLFADLIPTNIYWFDVNNIVLGANSTVLKTLGMSPDKVIGKTLYQIHPKEIAEQIERHHIEALQRKRTVIHEEKIKDIKTKKVRYFTAVKTPLYHNKKILGTIASTFEITAQKEAEKLRLENATQILKIKIEEQKKFSQIANQLTHDIRSPLSTLKMWYASVKHKLSEKERIIGHNALNRANDILNSGFLRYKPTAENIASLDVDTRTDAMIFSILEQVIAEKRLEYQQQPIAFEIACEPSALAACFQVKGSDFKRMISNLVNNAVDAFENNSGKISFHLKADKESITLTIQDNGKGMPESVRKKILSHTAITSGKKHGNGIGFTQIWDTMNNCGGKLSIASKRGAGTKIQLIFPRIAAPGWVVEHIVLSTNDIVVIVDDEPTIHDAWQVYFQRYASETKLINFEKGEEAITFLQNAKQKENLFLLTDYELLNQPVNGLDIIEKTGIKRAILVTNHSEDQEVQHRALALNAGILPKTLAASIPLIHKKAVINLHFAEEQGETRNNY